MKKILLFILPLFIALAATSQIPFPGTQTSGSPQTLNKFAGGIKAGVAFVNAIYTDTAAANASQYAPFYGGAQIFTTSDNTIWVRNAAATAWINHGPGGSLVSTVNIVDSNHISICNPNGCDTITINGIIGDIINITIRNDTTLQICGSDILGPNLLANGGFVGGTTGWTVQNLWAYGTNNIIHSFGDTLSTYQAGTLVEGALYYVTGTVGGSTGTLTLSLDGGTRMTFNAGAGPISFYGTWSNVLGQIVGIIPSIDFDGTVTDVSVKKPLANCDTLQTPPTNFLIPDTLFFISPIHTLTENTVYMTQAGPTFRNGVSGDSGWISTAAYDSFLYKANTVTHTYGNNQDIIQYTINDSIVNADTIDIQCDGFGSNPPQVAPSGDTLGFIVSSGNYRIHCKPYTSPQTLLFVQQDATFPRFATFIVDSSGNARVILGDPAATPLIPEINTDYQLKLSSILIPAVGSQPTVDSLIIFNSNIAGEWVPITITGTTANPNNTVNPYKAPISMDITNIRNGQSIRFNAPAPITVTNYSSVVGFIQLKQTLPANANINVRWTVNGVGVGNFIPITLVRSNRVSYQYFSIPVNSFTLGAITQVNGLSITYNNTTNAVYAGFYLDYVFLQHGVDPTPPGSGSVNIEGYNGVTHFKNNNIDSIRLGGTLNQNTTIAGAGFYTAINGGRFETGKGVAVAAANSLTLGGGGNLFSVTGNTQINAITTANWQAGSQVQFIFTGTPTLKNNTAGGAGTATLLLAGRVDYTAAAGDYIALQYDGTNWYETERKISAASGLLTANNGLTASSPSNVQLGGSLVQNTTITTGSSFNLTMTGGGAGPNVVISNTLNSGGGGTALQVVSPKGIGVQAISFNGGVAMEAITSLGSGGGYAIIAQASEPGNFGILVTSSDTTGIIVGSGTQTTGSTVTPILSIGKNTSIPVSAGFGGSIDISLSDDGDINGRISNRLISFWTNPSDGSQTSQFDISGVHTGAEEIYANFQTGGIVRVNNLVDTLATKAYARSVGGGGGGGSGTVTSVATNTGTGITGGTITTTGTLAIDTANKISTLLQLQHRIDSLASTITVGNTIYTGDGSLAGDRVVDLATHRFRIEEGGNQFLNLLPDLFTSQLYATDGTANINFDLTANGAGNDVFFKLRADDGVADEAQILGRANAGTSTIEYQALGGHTFTGNVGIGAAPAALFQVFSPIDGVEQLLFINAGGFSSGVEAYDGTAISGFNMTANSGDPDVTARMFANNGVDPEVGVYVNATTQIMGLTAANGVNINGAYTFPTADGAADQVMTAHGDGTVTWETGGGGIGGSIANQQIAYGNGTDINGNNNFIVTFAGHSRITLQGSNSDNTLQVFNDGGTSQGQFTKLGSAYTTYKNFAAGDLGIYNDANAGNISILNDNTAGIITLAAGGTSSPQVVIFPGQVSINSSFALPYVAKTTTYSITNLDYTIDCTTGTFTVTLPTAVGIQGRLYNVKNSGAGIITIATTSSQTIDGSTTKTVATGVNAMLQSTGSNWIIL